jgi:mannose-6-phosphate isomerase-like protein (cupin superfamily)
MTQGLKAMIPVLALGATLAAQAPSGTQVTGVEMATALKGEDPAKALSDLPIRVLDIGHENLGVAIVRRTKAEVNALRHDKITEVYVVREGSGTMVTGGSLIDPEPITTSAAIGPGARGSHIEGGTSRRVAAGDVVVIPPGTPHMFTSLDGTIVYVTIRVDPTQVLPLK